MKDFLKDFYSDKDGLQPFEKGCEPKAARKLPEAEESGATKPDDMDKSDSSMCPTAIDLYGDVDVTPVIATAQSLWNDQ